MRQRIGVLALILVISGVTSRGQSPTAVVNGQVRDPSGAAIPGATVVIINDATGIRISTETNAEGIYSVSNLPPGTYRIQVSKQGFKTIVHPDIVLHVQDAEAISFTLPVGSTSDTVTVEGGAPLINTENAAVSTVVDRQFAENLPMNGRSFQTLIELTPGIVVIPSNAQDSGQFSVNGQRGVSNYWMVDGVSANVGVSSGQFPGNGVGGTLGTFSVQGGTNSLVSVDALQEFRVQTSTYAPEFGRTPGAQISIVTRSGANQFHGTAFDYLRNDLLDANDWFADSVGLKKPEERQNDFGGTFSGPILKDRTFFFFSYEGLRLRLPRTGLTTVPCDGSCSAFGNARTMAVSQMQPFLNAFPLPNGPEVFTPCTPNVNGCPASGEQPTGTAQFNRSFSNKSTLNAYSLRIDHKLNDKLNVFGRYNYSPSETVARGSAGSSIVSLAEIQPARVTVQTGTIGSTWFISSTVTNDLRFNYSRTRAESSSFLDNFGGGVPLTALPVPSPLTSRDAIFGLTINGQATYSIGPNGQNIQRQINVVDCLSAQKRRHGLKFGVDFRRLSPTVNPALYTQLPLFPSVMAAENGSSLFGEILSNAHATVGFRNFSAFAQDTWRVVPRLSLTYGFRWDLDFAPSSLNGPSIPAVTGYNLNDFSQLAIAPPGTAPFKTTYGNVAPRVGLAYELVQRQNWGTVLRGGFGVFYDLASSETWHALASKPPFASAPKFVPGASFPFPYDAAEIAPPPIPPTGDISDLAALNPNLKLPYTLEWNVAIEQGLGREQSISASYLGTAGRRLLQTTLVSFPSTNPAVSGNFVDNTATSDYHALQIQFQRRLSRGLQVLTSYTWSHSIDSASAGSPAAASNDFVPAGNTNWASSDFDIRHSLSAGFTYAIPSPKSNAVAGTILGGWSAESILLARSAPPVDLSDSNFFEFASGLIADIRPDLVPGQQPYLFGSNLPGGKSFNPSAFTDPPTTPPGCLLTFAFPCNPARQGNVPRNFLRGFGATQWDFAVHRDFPIHESVKLQFRAEMFNVLNHPNFGQPIGDISGFTGPFGLANQMLGQSLNNGNLGGGAFDPLYQIGGPRSIQFALKLAF